MIAPAQTSRWLEMSVLEMLNRWPATAQVFIRYRMACVGCDFSRFDLVREALQVHGLSFQEFTQALAGVIDPEKNTGQPPAALTHGGTHEA
jgi:hybrid cluster-associated redox disulfide protein